MDGVEGHPASGSQCGCFDLLWDSSFPGYGKKQKDLESGGALESLQGFCRGSLCALFWLGIFLGAVSGDHSRLCSVPSAGGSRSVADTAGRKTSKTKGLYELQLFPLFYAFCACASDQQNSGPALESGQMGAVCAVSGYAGSGAGDQLFGREVAAPVSALMLEADERLSIELRKNGQL